VSTDADVVLDTSVKFPSAVVVAASSLDGIQVDEPATPVVEFRSSIPSPTPLEAAVAAVKFDETTVNKVSVISDKTADDIATLMSYDRYT